MRTDTRARRGRNAGHAVVASIAVLGSVSVGATPVAGASPSALPRQSRDSVRVTGVVDDVAGGGPVYAASLYLVHPVTGATLASAESDSVGAFVFPTVARGDYLVRVERIGFESLREPVSLHDAHVDLYASLVPVTVDLEPMVVTIGRRRSPQIEAFERRRARGFGSFITREDLERVRPYRVTDALRRIPGLRVEPGTGTDDARILMRGRCQPSVYIDGVPSVPGLSLDLSLRPDDVEGIEVYSTATVPPQYAREACGVLLVWTREPRPTTGPPGWWKKLIIATAVMGVLIAVN